MISTTNLEFKTLEPNKAKESFDQQGIRTNSAPDVITPRFPFYVRDRLPVHILENHDLYVKFIEAYFEWLGISNNIDQIPYLVDINNYLLIFFQRLLSRMILVR